MSDSEQPPEAEGHAHHDHGVEGPGYATPQAAIEEADREKTAYVMGLYVGTDVDAPDFLAVVDVDPESDTYGEIVDRLEMPNRGDELHHFGWNACSSSCHIDGLERRHLVIPGQRSSRIHVVDTAERRNPEFETVIEPEEVYEHDLSAPHTVHCIPDGEILISMLGNADGELPGGFLELNENFEVEGRWDPPGEIEMNYDFWYQPRHDVMVSTEWAAPETYYPGFDLEDVEAGNYGRRLTSGTGRRASSNRPSTSARRATSRSKCGSCTPRRAPTATSARRCLRTSSTSGRRTTSGTPRRPSTSRPASTTTGTCRCRRC